MATQSGCRRQIIKQIILTSAPASKLAVLLGSKLSIAARYESFATVGEIRVYRRADFQSGSRVLKKVF